MNYNTLDPDQCEFVVIADQGDIPNGERLFVEIDGDAIVVFNIGGTFFAIADVCSHDDGPLGDGEIDGHEVSCPRHGARFDVRTGETTRYPAVESIDAYPTRVNADGEIELGLPLEA
jgi:3-phenylpropionate/trans-cinnamate dioxygenase ferredoxin subunit